MRACRTPHPDPVERQDHLRALALIGLVLHGSVLPSQDPVGVAPTCAAVDGPATGSTSAVGCTAPSGAAVRAASARRPETITVIDLRTLVAGWHERSFVDLGVDGLELPLDVIVRRALVGEIVPVFVDRDGVVVQVGERGGRLDLGRTSRLAGRAQRRALRAMYARCAIPGCGVPFDHCQPHHIVWWRHGGRTDLANLVPLCARHHHSVHDDGWVLSLGVDRSLTVRRPDGTVLRGGPPRAEPRP